MYYEFIIKVHGTLDRDFIYTNDGPAYAEKMAKARCRLNGCEFVMMIS
jgi:hypothetical protein